jgi:signal peptidase I
MLAGADPPEPASDAPAPPTEGRRAGSCLLELVQTVVGTVVLFVVIQTFIAQPFQVQMDSMERTFEGGDYLIVDRLSHLWSPYTRGQVIVFHPPPGACEGDKPFIKRVIGIGGDTVEIRDGTVFINGVALDEPYLYRDGSGDVEPTDPLGDGASWLVPDGDLFVMGDHREVSSDSRVFGPIEVSSVIGRGLLRYWPFDRFGVIGAATYDNLPAP